MILFYTFVYFVWRVTVKLISIEYVFEKLVKNVNFAQINLGHQIHSIKDFKSGLRIHCL